MYFDGACHNDIYTCGPMRTYVWAYADVRVDLCGRTYRLMRIYV